MQSLGATSCTDITGSGLLRHARFALLRHAYEMAKGSGVTLSIDSGAVPLLPDVIDLIGQQMLTRSDKNNRLYVGDTINISGSVSKEMQSALYDPQTAGGLLISLPADQAEQLINEIEGAQIIGSVGNFEKFLIEVR